MHIEKNLRYKSLLLIKHILLSFSFFQRKEYVLENIAFSSNKNEVMFHAGCWTYQDCILKHCTNMKLETLLTETGHRKIN